MKSQSTHGQTVCRTWCPLCDADLLFYSSFFFFFSAVALLACLSCAAVLLQCQAALSVSKHRVAVFAGLKREFPSQWVFTGSIPPSENESLFTADLKYLTELRWFWCAVVSYHHSWTSAASLICSQYCEACLLKYYFNRCTRNWTKKNTVKKSIKRDILRERPLLLTHICSSPKTIEIEIIDGLEWKPETKKMCCINHADLHLEVTWPVCHNLFAFL